MKGSNAIGDSHLWNNCRSRTNHLEHIINFFSFVQKQIHLQLSTDKWIKTRKNTTWLLLSLYIKCGKVSVRMFVRNAGRGQLSNEWCHNENDVIMRTRAVSAKRGEGKMCKWSHNENDVIMIIADWWRYGDWRYVATGCNALVVTINAWIAVTLSQENAARALNKICLTVMSA